MTVYTKKRKSHAVMKSRQISLVYSDTCSLSHDDTLPEVARQLTTYYRHRITARVAAALMCRLWIPSGTTIVGLLGVGASRSNYDEILKWVERELYTTVLPESEEIIDEFCRRLLETIDNRMTELYFVESFVERP